MKKDSDKISGILSGVSGEYFVAAELSRRGFIASLTLKNTRGIDILVSNVDAKKTLGIQVKTNQIGKQVWLLNEKAENFHADNLFYVFVNLISLENLPEFHIVPSKIVADYVKKGHHKWLKAPGKKGQKRNNSSMRKFSDEAKKYIGGWNLLSL